MTVVGRLSSFVFNKICPEEVEEDGISIDTYVNAFRRCKHLIEVSLLGDVMQHFTDIDLHAFKECGPLISAMEFESQRKDEQLTSYGLSSFLAYCSQLLSLTCNGIDKDDATIVQQLGVSCPKLYSVSLMEMTDVADECFVTMLQGCPQLKTISLSCASTLNIPTNAIFTHQINPLLQTIDLSVHGVMWDETTVATCFAHCHELEYFHVVWGRFISDPIPLRESRSLDDKGCAILAKGCPKLRFIQLYPSTSLTIHGLRQFGEHCPLFSKLTIREFLVGDRPSQLCPENDLKTYQERFPGIIMKIDQRRVTVNPPPVDGDNNPVEVVDNVFPAAENMEVV